MKYPMFRPPLLPCSAIDSETQGFFGAADTNPCPHECLQGSYVLDVVRNIISSSATYTFTRVMHKGDLTFISHPTFLTNCPTHHQTGDGLLQTSGCWPVLASNEFHSRRVLVPH